MDGDVYLHCVSPPNIFDKVKGFYDAGVPLEEINERVISVELPSKGSACTNILIDVLKNEVLN